MSVKRIRVEAEAMQLTNYRIESGNSSASGNALIGLFGAGSGTGYAAYTFAGSSGTYDIVIGYYDETDGASTLQVSVNNITFPAWQLNQNLGSAGPAAQTLVRRTVASGVLINEGQTIQIKGIANKAEWARVDYIDLVPHTNGGSISSNTISYEQASKGVFVNLAQGFSLVPTYSTPLKIMPLGDSITYGVKATFAGDTESGGYRTSLWQRLVGTDGLKVDFVGSLSNGPSGLGDKDHEGHRAYKIEDIAKSVNGWLSTSKPDVVLLMIGTNNARSESVSAIGTKFSNLIDQITSNSPATQLLVASIPPMDSDFQSAASAQRAVDFNKAIPGIISTKANQGKKVSFVDMRSLTVNDLTSSSPPASADNGLHPNSQGYSKIANFWHDAVLNKAGDKADIGSDIDNITGSKFADTLIGNAGSNRIKGGFGKDTLTGKGGVDTFVYNSPNQGNDTIADFSQNDILAISASGFGGGLKKSIPLSTTAAKTGTFISDTNPVSLGSSGNFLYHNNTGLLSFDIDGTGLNTPVNIATLKGAPSLHANQFLIVA